MSKISNKLVWGLPAAFIFCCLLIPVAIWSIKNYRLASLKKDLWSKDEKRMESSFKELIDIGEKGFAVLEDFCRQNTSMQWGKAEGGLRVKIEMKRYVSRVSELLHDNSSILILHIQNLTDNSIKISKPKTMHLPLSQHHFAVFKRKIRGSIYAGSSFSIFYILKPKETIKIAIGLNDLVWHKRDLGMFYNARFEYSSVIYSLVNPPGSHGIEKISNPVTFIILP